MKKIIILKSACLIAVSMGLAACSSQRQNEMAQIESGVQSSTNTPLVKPKIKKIAPVARKAVVKKSKLVVEKRSPKKQSKKSVATKRKVIQKKRVVKRAPAKRQYARKRIHQRKVDRKVNRQQRQNHYRAPVSKIRYAQLKGDYANNPRALAFINMMSAKHGFDRGYLNYLLSNTKSTPFLARMAYADANPKKRNRKKPRAGRWTRYRGNFLTSRTINKGLAFARANRVALQRAEDKYGVPKEYILGIIGVETRYGENVGKNRAIDALAAMGFENARRGKYFQSELEAFLVMSRKEGLDPLKPMASYAGALGLCQFMPSNIKRYAVDHDHSGTVNLWTPHDAIGSVANYFKKHGWRTGGTVAVRADSNGSRYKTLKTGFKSKHSLSRLKSKGVSARNLGNISGKASLLRLNTYSGDELWLGGHNFYVITRYNHSTHYAMAVHQLGQAIKARLGGRDAVRQASNDVDLKSDGLALLMK